jgi:hypothetical protein
MLTDAERRLSRKPGHLFLYSLFCYLIFLLPAILNSAVLNRRVMNLVEGPLRLVSTSLIVGVHIGTRALHVLNLIWFGNIACLSQWGGARSFPRSNVCYLPSLRVEEGGRGSAYCVLNPLLFDSTNTYLLCA